jgi:hypothetical protein
MSHNTILVDDFGEGLAYPPNQGRWGTASRTTRFVDAGDYVAARGDFGDAYRPPPQSGRPVTVQAVVRDLVFARPGLLVIRDRVRVAKPTYGVAWALHGSAPLAIDATGSAFRIASGSSRADVVVLDPPNARAVMKAEPSPTGEGPWFNNEPADRRATRVEVSSPKGDTSRSFLVSIQVGALTVPASAVTMVHGDGVVGALFAEDRRARLVAFASEDAAEKSFSFEGPNLRADLLVGLKPGAGYSLRAERSRSECRIHVALAGSEESARRATSGGTLAYSVEECVIR